ncbi:hypothetical protein PQZ39_00550 [bacterium]|nr:hypothetical protein [bacterium]
MSFLIGFSFIVLLLTFTIVLGLISKRLPSEFILAPVVFMILGDAVLVGLWYYGLVDLIEIEKVFRLGIAAAFCTVAMGRSIYFLITNKEINGKKG